MSYNSPSYITYLIHVKHFVMSSIFVALLIINYFDIKLIDNKINWRLFQILRFSLCVKMLLFYV